MDDNNDDAWVDKLSARWPQLIAWNIIFLCVGFSLAPEVMRLALPRVATVTAPSGAEAVDRLVRARYLVGMHALIGQEIPEQMTQGFADLEQGVDDPARRLRLSVIAGEVLDDGAARTRLAQIVQQEDASAQVRADAAALARLYETEPQPPEAALQPGLIERHGWFARLALSHGRASEDADRRAALAPAWRTIATVFGGMLLVGLVVIAGLVLAIIVGQRFIRKTTVIAPRAPVGHASAYVEAFAWYLSLFMLVSLALGWWLELRGAHGSRLVWTWALLPVALPLPLVWLRLRGNDWAQVRQAVGLHVGRGWMREIGSGLLGYLTGVPLLAAGYAATMGLSWWLGASPDHPAIHAVLQGSETDLLNIFLLATVFAPLVEETMFRGVLLHHLRHRLPWWGAALVVSLVFAAIHPQGLAGIPALAAIALVLAGIRTWRGSLIASMAAHAAHNGVTLAFAMLLVR